MGEGGLFFLPEGKPHGALEKLVGAETVMVASSLKTHRAAHPSSDSGLDAVPGRMASHLCTIWVKESVPGGPRWVLGS